MLNALLPTRQGCARAPRLHGKRHLWGHLCFLARQGRAAVEQDGDPGYSVSHTLKKRLGLKHARVLCSDRLANDAQRAALTCVVSACDVVILAAPRRLDRHAWLENHFVVDILDSRGVGIQP